MKLYYIPGACSLTPHIILRETGQSFALEKVDPATHRTASGGDYYAVSSKGAVPVLALDDDTRLSEGPVIVQYLCDLAGRDDLMPAAGSLARYRVMEWQNYITSELHKGFSPLFNPALGADAKTLLGAVLRKKFEWVNTQLGAGPYLTGSTFTGADAYLFTVSRWAAFVGPDLADLAPLQAFLRRVGERPAVRDALRAEGLPH